MKINLKKTIPILTITILLISTIAFIGIPITNATPTNNLALPEALEAWGDATAEWNATYVYSGSYSVKLTPIFESWIDAAGVKVLYNDLLTTINHGDLYYWIYVETGQNPYPVLYLDTTGDGEVDAWLHGNRVTDETKDKWINTAAPYQDGSWKKHDYTEGGYPGTSGTAKTIDEWKTALPAITKVIYVGIQYGNIANGICYVDDITIKGVTYPLEPLGGYLKAKGEGIADLTTAEKHTGSYSAKLHAPATGGDYGKIVVPTEMAFEDLADFSCYVKGDSDGEDLPLLEIELKEITANVTVGAETIDFETVGRINIASQPEDAGYKKTNETSAKWEQYGTHSGADIDASGDWWRVFWDADGDGTFDTNSGALLNWTAIHTAFDGKATTESVRVELRYPPTAESTVYVDDITVDTVSYTLEPSLVLNKPFYHTGETATVTVTDFYTTEDVHRAESIEVTVTSDVPDSVTVTATETDLNNGVFTGTFNLVEENPGVNDLLVTEGSTVTVTYLGYTDTASVDNTPPTVTGLTPPENGNISQTYGFNVEATVEDPTSGIDIAWLVLDGTIRAVESDGTSVTLSYTVPEIDPLGEGVHNVSVTAQDVAGNINDTTTWSFNIDVTGPTCVIDMNVTSPIKAVDVEFTFEFNEDMDVTSEVTIDGNATDHMSTPVKGWKDTRTYSANCTVESAAFNGTVLLDASGATDVSGKEMVPANFTFYIDTINPTVPENLTATAEVGANVLDWDAATDLGSGVASYNVYYNTTETGWQLLKGGVVETTYRHATGVPETRYFYKVSAVDAAGNEGLPSDVVNATYMGAYSIELEEGWNLISLPLVPDNSSIEAILADVVDNVTVVWSYDAETREWFSFKPGAPSTLTEIVDGKGYWVNMTESATLTIYGSVLPPPPAVPPAYDVVPGWNLIGYKETTRMNASTYLDGIEYKRLYAYYGGAYHLVEPSDDMVPGLGYWIAVTEEGIIYP